MSIDEAVAKLNKSSMFLTGLTQLNDGKRWSASVRKKGDFTHGYGQGSTPEKAIKAAIAKLKEHWGDKQWKEFAQLPKPQPPKPRKRVSLKARRRK